GDNHSSENTDNVAAISADGRFVVFASLATDLVVGDTNGFRDIFVRDRTLGTTVRASVNTDGSQADNDCMGPAISGDGSTVAFHSLALTLVTPNDTGIGGEDVFVHDLASATTTKITANTAGGESNGQAYYPSLSYDGRYVAFESSGTDLGPADGNSGADIYVYDRWTTTMEIVSVSSDEVQANDYSMWAQISADGRYVAFWSQASNLVAGAPIGSYYLRDRDMGTTVGLPAGAKDPAFPNQ
ncbi:MAG: PD40 domain-containing protein, partial [Planctomycetes bacterium]|nr:PD40 domain-containing protein [Planctomycetota bacterium]